jgi:translation elongation factor EF-1beta
LRFASYILMELSPGMAKTAADAISKIEGVKMVHAVTGPFDVIAFVEVPDLASLSDLVLEKIQSIEGVKKTQTAVVVTPDVFGSSLRQTRSYKSPSPPKKWVEETVRSILSSNPELSKNTPEVLKLVRVEARRNNYRPVIPPAQVQALLKKR